MIDRRPHTWILTTGLLTLLACGADSSGVASAKDPSSPHAPEGRPSLAAPVAPTPSDAGHSHASNASDAGPLVYACPMHPEVTATQPGTCPKCLMKLVPR